jgi:hypothetical protein
MRKIFYLVILLLISSPFVYSQTIKLQEGFETADSLNLPEGWHVYNEGGYYTDPFWNWTVRDSGVSLPGLASATSVAHLSLKAVGVSWYVGNDTNGTAHQPDAWLISKKISGITSGDVLKFWATGGNPNFLDSIQVCVSTLDSTPQTQIFPLATIIWPAGSVYGQFTQYSYDLSAYAGGDLWVGFRYFTNISTDGFFVHVDDVSVINPIGVHPIGTGVPFKFGLGQNYPNPFNPKTTINFDIAKATDVKISLFNTLGQEVNTLVNQYMTPGSYKVDFDASSYASGTYYYRITAGDFVETKKMVIVK